MARFLRKVRVRVERLGDMKKPESEFDSIAGELLTDFDLSGSHKDRARLRLRVGLEDLYQKLYDVEIE
jgi:hypothetical protein